jgi:hypothetical protein
MHKRAGLSAQSAAGLSARRKQRQGWMSDLRHKPRSVFRGRFLWFVKQLCKKRHA